MHRLVKAPILFHKKISRWLAKKIKSLIQLKNEVINDVMQKKKVIQTRLKLFIKQTQSSFRFLKKTILHKLKMGRSYVLFVIEQAVKKYLLTFICGSILYFLLLIFLSFCLGYFLKLSLLKNQVPQYFIGAAAMLGSILAIISSFSLTLIQNAAENFSAGFYNISGRDKVQDGVFAFIIFVVIIFFSASLFTHDYFILIFGSQISLGTVSLQISVFSIGLILYLIYYLYRRVFFRMQPLAAIKAARDSAISKINIHSQKVKEMADVIASDPKNKPQASIEEYSAYLYQKTSPIPYLNERLSYLFDFHDKLISKNEKTLAIVTLDAIAEIIKAYFLTRTNSSLILPTEYFFATTSDSQSFLTPNLERMISTGKDYMRNHDGNGISKVIHVLKSLCFAAGNIEYIGGRHNDKPILEQCIGYLNQLVDSTIEMNNEEGVFQASEAYKTLAVNAINIGYYIELGPIYDMLDKLTKYSAKKRFEASLTSIFDTYRSIIDKLFRTRWNAEHELENLFDHLENTVIWSFVLVLRNNLHDRHFTQTHIAKPYNHLKDLLVSVPRIVDNSPVEEQRKWIYTLLKAVEALRKSLRSISESINNADHILVWSFGIIIKDIGILLLALTQKDNWKEHKQELIRQAQDYLHQTKWFSAGATSIEDNDSYDQLIEATAQIGIKALEINEVQIADDSIDVLYSFAVEMLQKQKPPAGGDSEPEIMLRACCIGIIALKNSKIETLNKLKEKIKQFQPLYEAKWFKDVPVQYEASFPRNQLKKKVEGLLRHRIERRGLIDFENSTESVLLRKANNTDIQNFITYIWPS